MPQDNAKPKVGPLGYHLRHSKRHVPTKVSYPTPLSLAAELLHLGADKNIAVYLGPPATPGAVRSWRRGQRRTPAWVLDRLAHAQTEHANATTMLGEWIARAKKEASESAGLG